MSAESDSDSLRVRTGQKGDLRALCQLVADQHATELYIKTLSIDRVSEEIWRCLIEGVVCVAETEEGEIAGAIALAEDRIWWSDEKVLTDRCFFVYPRHRKGGTARNLLLAARKAARIFELSLVLTLARPATRAECRFYEINGFRNLGTLWIGR